MSAGLCIGTSGWSYDCWRDDFYAGVPRKHWLRHYASRFNAVEVNASFYGQLRPTTYQHWSQDTPSGFVFTLKAHRYLTHMTRLAFPLEALLRQRDAALPLAGKLAAIVWQMPAKLAFDLPRLERFASMLEEWREVRHVLEFRDDSWFCPATADALSAHRLAVCQSDAHDWPLWSAVTTDLVYVRLHGHDRTYSSPYPDDQLRAWAVRIERWRSENRSVHVYFDNTDSGHAIQDAERLKAMLDA